MKRRLSLGWKIAIIGAAQVAGVLAGLATATMDPIVVGLIFAVLNAGMAYIGVQAGKEARPS